MKVSMKLERDVEIGDDMLAVRHLNKEGVLHDVSFTVRKGEILGMFGLVGAGRTEAVRAVLGVDKYDSAEIELEGKPVRFKSMRDALKHGVALVPEERRKQGILPNTEIYKNVSIGNLDALSKGSFIDKAKERAYADEVTKMLSVACASINQTVGSLSGGNQQKVVISKYIDRDIKVLIFDEPTRGIDVGAKDQIYEIINNLCKRGMSVIVISSEIPELQLMCDRICVMSEGRITSVVERSEFANSDNILRNAIGI
jgi:ribose transport system ATP-binding protein